MLSFRRLIFNSFRARSACGGAGIKRGKCRAIWYSAALDGKMGECSLSSHTRSLSHNTMSSADISIVPDGHLLVDDELHIKVSGLQRQQKVTIYVYLEEDNKKFESWGWFIADQNGIVDLYSQASVNGTYTGISPMGIFWSMEQVPGQKKGIRIMKKNVDSPFACQLYVHQGHVTADEIRNQQTTCLGTRTIERWYKAPGVTSEEVTSGRLRGRLYMPQGEGPFQGIVDLFGTVGGITDFRSALLASRGFASLTLPYFAYKDLPKTLYEIELEYFSEAVDWLLSHDKVCSKGAGVVGVSKGGDISLLMGAYCPKVQAVVNINGCTFNATYPIKFQNEVIEPVECQLGKMEQVEEDVYCTVKTLDYKLQDLTPIWNTDTKVLNICSEDDMCSPHECILMMEEHYPADKKQNFIVARYPDAGHLVEPPYTPLCRLSYHKTYNISFLWGGQPKPHADAQEDSWKKILKFLRENIPKDSPQVVTSKL